MFKKRLILVYVVSIATQWTLSWGENYDFRYTRWGMTTEEVIASEKMDPIEKNGKTIKYKTQILGKNVELIYIFDQNKLIGSLYKLDENYLNSEHFIKTYNEFKEVLMKKYGQSNREITKWTNDIYKNVRTKWGLALSLGHTEYGASWKTQRTIIECSLREVNYYVLCLIEYWNAEYQHLSADINKEEKLDPF